MRQVFGALGLVGLALAFATPATSTRATPRSSAKNCPSWVTQTKDQVAALRSALTNVIAAENKVKDFEFAKADMPLGAAHETANSVRLALHTLEDVVPPGSMQKAISDAAADALSLYVDVGLALQDAREADRETGDKEDSARKAALGWLGSVEGEIAKVVARLNSVVRSYGECDDKPVPTPTALGSGTIAPNPSQCVNQVPMDCYVASFKASPNVTESWTIVAPAGVMFEGTGCPLEGGAGGSWTLDNSVAGRYSCTWAGSQWSGDKVTFFFSTGSPAAQGGALPASVPASASGKFQIRTGSGVCPKYCFYLSGP